MSPSAVLLLKLTLAPCLVGMATLLMARVGPMFGGLITALPVVGGPILLLFAIEQGNAFAANAAAKALIGTVALLAYTTCYVELAVRRSGNHWPWFCLVTSWLSFVTVALALEPVPWPKVSGAPLALGAILVAVRLLPRRPLTTTRTALNPTALHLVLLRMGAAGGMVALLSWAAGRLGPTWSGLLTAFPVVSTVMLIATHLEHGLESAVRWLRGFYWGLLGYVTFVSTIAYGLESLGLATAFGIGIALAAAVQGVVNSSIRD